VECLSVNLRERKYVIVTHYYKAELAGKSLQLSRVECLTVNLMERKYVIVTHYYKAELVGKSL
jgi:quinolinate synthase